MATLLAPLGSPGQVPPSEAPPPTRAPVPAKGLPEEALPEEDGEFDFDPAQKPRADARPLYVIDPENRTAAIYLSGGVEWKLDFRGTPLRLQADRLLIHVRWEEGAADAGRPAVRPRRGGLPRVRDFTFHAQGNVRLEVPARRTYIEADSFFYEHATARAVARGARLKTIVRAAHGLLGPTESSRYRPGPELPPEDLGRFADTPLSIHARELRMIGFERFQGEGVEVSSCDFAVPHFALGAATVDVYPVEEGAPGDGRRGRARGPAGGQGAPPAGKAGEPGTSGVSGLTGKDFIIDPEQTTFDLYGKHVLPLPVSYWDTRWNAWQPVRKIDVGSSSKFGFFAGVDWNVNWFLGLVPPTRFLPLDVVNEEVQLDFETDYLEKRGFGYGPKARYGKDPDAWLPWQLQLEEWSYYGEAGYFAIDDHGDEDRSTRLPPPREHRYWGHVWHRQSVPHLGLLDVEFSKLSDNAFLGEYYEPIAKEEKEQESLVYLRRNVDDNLALAGLYEYRVNDFQAETERLPEGKLFLFQEPVFRSGLYTDVSAQAAYLHRLEDDALNVPPRGFGRYDVLNEWSYPFGFAPYIQTRPFTFVRLSQYDEVLDPAQGSEDRAAMGGGITASQEWSRIYRFGPDSVARDILGLSTMKHVIVPEVTYLNLFINDLPSDELIPIDATDEVDLEESISFSLRNAFYTRAPSTKPITTPPLPQSATAPPGPPLPLRQVPWETRSLLDSEVSFVLFPQPSRDNGGDTSSLLVLDNTVNIIPRTAVRAWLELDPNRDFRLERSDLSVAWEAIANRLHFTVGDRLTREQTNYLYGLVGLRLTEKWHVDAYYSHDFETGRDGEYSFGLSRYFHRFVLSLEVSQDVGEDRNTTFHVNFVPLEFFRPRGSRRSW